MKINPNLNDLDVINKRLQELYLKALDEYSKSIYEDIQICKKDLESHINDYLKDGKSYRHFSLWTLINKSEYAEEFELISEMKCNLEKYKKMKGLK